MAGAVGAAAEGWAVLAEAPVVLVDLAVAAAVRLVVEADPGEVDPAVVGEVGSVEVAEDSAVAGVGEPEAGRAIALQ